MRPDDFVERPAQPPASDWGRRTLWLVSNSGNGVTPMATSNQLRTAIRAQPFRPFTVRLADGRAFFVKHPELISVGPNGREVVIHADEGMSLIEGGLVAEVRIA